MYLLHQKQRSTKSKIRNQLPKNCVLCKWEENLKVSHIDQMELTVTVAYQSHTYQESNQTIVIQSEHQRHLVTSATIACVPTISFAFFKQPVWIATDSLAISTAPDAICGLITNSFISLVLNLDDSLQDILGLETF